MTAALPRKIEIFIGQKVGTSEFECLQLAGDASTRKYYRIVYANQSCVLMSWEPFPDPVQYPFLNVLEHFARVGVRVPQVLAFAAELGVVLLEDLGDLTLERKFWENQDQAASLPFYSQAIDEIIKVHFLATPIQKPLSICQTTQFDTAKFMWEMNYAREHFIEKVGQIQLNEKDQATLQREFLMICDALSSQPQFVCHRDYHSRNLMLKLGRIYVIDFQDARLGPIQYDLVSLVHDSYVGLSNEMITTIKNDYLAKARECGPPNVIQNNFEDIFKIQIIQRCFKACGSFSSFYNARNDTRYLKYLKNTSQLVAQTLSESSHFPLMREVFTSYGLVERDYTTLCAP